MSFKFRKYYPFILLILSGYISFSHFYSSNGINRRVQINTVSSENLYSKSLKLYNAGSIDSSIILLNKIIELSPSGNGDNYNYKALIQKARILKNQGLFKTALYLLNSFSVKTDSLLESERLINKVDVFISLGYYSSADSCLEALNIFPKSSTDSVLSLKLNTLKADICFYKGKFSEGLEYAEAALSFCTNTEKDKILISETYNVIGKLYFGTKDYSSALSYFNKALKLREEFYGSCHPETAKILHNLGSTYYDMSDLVNSEAFLKKALDIRINTLGEINPSTADSYNNLGNLYKEAGELDLAAVYLRKALTIREETLGRLNNALVITYNNLGNVYLDKKQYDEAYRCYLTGLELKSQITSSEDLDNILLFNNLGIVLKQQSKYPKALSYFKRAIAIETKLLGSNHLWSAFINLNIGTTYSDLKDYKKSREYLLKALDNLKYLPEKKHPLKAELFYELALIDYEKGNLKAGLENLQNAMMIIDLRFNPKSIFENPDPGSLYLSAELVKILDKKGEIFLKLNETTDDIKFIAAAENVFNTASRVLDNIRRSYKAESSKLDLGTSAKSIYEKGLEASYILYKKTGSIDYLNEAFEYSEKSRSLKLIESIADTKAKLSGNIPDSLLQYENKLKQSCLVYEHKLKAVIDNGATYESDEAALLNSGLLDISIKHQKLISRFEKEFPDYYRLKYSVDIAKIEDVRNDLLNKNQTAIEYFLGKESLYIIIISKDNNHLLKLRKPEKLKDIIQQFRESIVQMDFKLYTYYAYELYTKIFKPAEMYLSGTEVIIVPDGMLGYIPFEALLSEPAERNKINYKTLAYLVKKYQFSYSNSCTLLKEGLSVRVNPDYDKVGGFAPGD